MKSLRNSLWGDIKEASECPRDVVSFQTSVPDEGWDESISWVASVLRDEDRNSSNSYMALEESLLFLFSIVVLVLPWLWGNAFEWLTENMKSFRDYMKSVMKAGSLTDPVFFFFRPCLLMESNAHTGINKCICLLTKGEGCESPRSCHRNPWTTIFKEKKNQYR